MTTLDLARRLLIMALWREIKARKKRPQFNPHKFNARWDFWRKENE